MGLRKMLAINGFSSRLSQVMRDGAECLLQFHGPVAIVQGTLRSIFHVLARPSSTQEGMPACKPGGGSASAVSAPLSREARVFIGEAEGHLMACYRQEITPLQCTVRLEQTLQSIVVFARGLGKSRSYKDCDYAGLDRLIGDIECARQSVLRLLRWIENDGLSDRILPPCGGAGGQAQFAVREADGSLCWIGLLNWSFDGTVVKGFDHVGKRPVELAVTDLADWHEGPWHEGHWRERQ